MENGGVTYKQLFEYGKRLCDASDEYQQHEDKLNMIGVIALVCWVVGIMLIIT